MARRTQDDSGGYGASPFGGAGDESFASSGRVDNLETLSTLQVFDLLRHDVPFESPMRPGLDYLRARIEEMETVNEQARQAVEKLDEAVKKLSSPANRVGTLLDLPKPDIALVAGPGGEFYCSVDPRLSQESLLVGTRVLLNEAFAVIGDLGFDRGGPIVKVVDVLNDGRLRIGSEAGATNSLILRSAPLAKERLKVGTEVRLDPTGHVAVEALSPGRSRDHLLENVPELPWDRVGGQKAAIEAVRDAIELPLMHGDLFKQYGHSTPKGILLYGPPGCGKTLIGKATAYNLTRQLRNVLGENRREYFMHIKGPEILNMWVGESERQVREIFAQAREKAKDGFLPFIFIDEAESLLGTRRAGHRMGLTNTLVPMFCAEMDGIESLHEMVIILASNRADMIDPAILRPGRIDRKIKVSRPNRAESAEIYRIYLRSGLPLDEALLKKHKGNRDAAVSALVEAVLAEQFDEKEANRFLEVQTRSGRREYLYRGNLNSGAIIASIVKRAKELAIKRAIEKPKQNGLTLDDLLTALDIEYRENDIFPPSDITEDWLKLVDYDPENVVKISPVKPHVTRASGVV